MTSIRFNKPDPVPPFYQFLDLMKNSDGELKCWYCKGHGWIHDPDDPPCSYEGSKYRDRITCPKCEGTGIGDKQTYLKLWHLRKMMYAEGMAEWKATNKIRNEIRKKLTREEKKLIIEASQRRCGLVKEVLK